MNQAVLVNKIRESSTQATGSDCRACPTAGLPILPVRYAVVPKATPGCVLPASCSNPLLDKSDQGKVTIKQSRYVLRTLRPGFLYLYYKNANSGAWTWQCYMISPSGALREIPLTLKGLVVPTDPPCDSAAHNVNSAIIALRNPEKITKAYIGYSEFFWSPQTRERSKKTFQPRLIEFSPAEWMKSHTQANVVSVAEMEETVLEYSALNLSKYLKSSYFEYKPRTGQGERLAARMERINPGNGMILAIPDPIGCVSDLNSYRMHAVDEYQRYVGDPERAWKLSSSTSIEGLRKLLAKQVNDSLKDAKPKYVSTGLSAHSVHTISKNEQIEQAINSGLERVEGHYSEQKRQSFLRDFDKHCSIFQERILSLDLDYVAWLQSDTLADAIADYDTTPAYSCDAATEVHCRILAGGVVSQASREYWKELTAGEVADCKDYASAGLLRNQSDWQGKFKNADEKNLVDHIWGENKGKLFDIAKSAIEADELKGANANANQALNKAAVWAADLLVTINGSIMAVIADVKRKAGDTLDDSSRAIVAKLEKLQIKLGLAYSHLHSRTGFALLQIDLTVDQWHQLTSSQLRQTMQGVSRQATHAFARMAMSSQPRIPPGSAAGQRVVSFTFWMSGTVQDIIKTIETASEGVIDGTAKVAKRGAQASASAAGSAGKATAATGKSVAGGLASGIRTVRLLAHNFQGGAKVFADLPSRLSSTEASKLAMRVSRNALATLRSADVKLAAPALVIQIFSLVKSIDEFNSSVGRKEDEAAWAVASSAFGVTSSAIELGAKAWQVLRPNASFAVGGFRVSAPIVIRGAGFVGAAASAIDGLQLMLKANTSAKRGDSDLEIWQSLMALAALGSTVASGAMALGYSALLGPVGVLLVCAAAGIVLTYVAFYAQDTAVGIWLDRCKFGNAERSEGQFVSRKHELDALELVCRDITIELEWMDKPLGSIRFDTDEISISVKRLGGRKDALILGLIVEGPAGSRQVFMLYHGIEKLAGHCVHGWPKKIEKMDKAEKAAGPGFEAKLLTGESEILHGTEGDQRIVIWQEAVKLDPAKFDRATLFVRYFPDREENSEYFDEEMLVADDSDVLHHRNKQKRIATNGK